jgi:hypothetical protein
MEGVQTIANAPAADEEEAALIAAGHAALPPPSMPPSVPESAAGKVVVAADDDGAPIKVRSFICAYALALFTTSMCTTWKNGLCFNKACLRRNFVTVSLGVWS